MGFIKKLWKDRISEFPARRQLTKENGSTELVTVARSEGTISQEGDAFSAENLNDLEERIGNGFQEVNSNLIVETISAATANANYITVASHRIRKQGKQIHGFIYFQTTQAVTGPANIISVGCDIPSTIYIPIYNLTDGTVGYGTMETTKYIKNGSALATNKVYLICIDFIQP